MGLQERTGKTRHRLASCSFRLDRQGELVDCCPGAPRSVEEVGRMAVKQIAHPSIEERKAEGKGARDPDASVEPLGVAPGGGPPGSGRAAGGAERYP